jgi:hypothetical protein
LNDASLAGCARARASASKQTTMRAKINFNLDVMVL